MENNTLKEINKEAADKIKGLIDIQKQNGNYNYDEYMYGMLIGLELAYFSLLGEEAQYTEKPEKWLSNKAYNDFVEGMRPMTEEERESLDEFTWNELKEAKLEIAELRKLVPEYIVPSRL
jgi:hypothetical protein